MFIDEDGKEANVSPFTEWSGSMMGLAGRDPIFFAQQESERTLQPSHDAYIQNTCSELGLNTTLASQDGNEEELLIVKTPPNGSDPVYWL